jgi:mannose-6-phosphate isomerase-like protein (cupin superfamily)
MFKTASQMQTELKERMRGGDGTVEMQHVFSADELTGKCRLMARVTLQPGCSIGAHVHDQEEEIYYLLEGVAMADDNGTPVEMHAGDALLTGGGKSHAIANHGNEPVVMLAIILLFV